MALVVKDRVKETTTTTGTGTITLAGAADGYQSFSVIGNANTTYYAIVGGNEWEVGVGTYTASGTTLSRDTVLESSNSGSLVNFSSGEKQVFCTYPAEKSAFTDDIPTNNNQLTNGAGYITGLSFNALSSKTSGTGDYSTNADLVSGRGSGGVALTINDGYGNANVTWNHQNGVPEQNGNAMRIEGNTDSTSGATLWFEGKSNVTGGSAVGLENWFTMSSSGATCLGNTVWHAGNDGSGSGLDADTLDGQHASAFASATHYHNRLYNGAVSTGAYVALSAGNELEYFNNSGTLQPLYIQYSGTATDLRGPGGNVIFTDGYHPNADKWTTARTLSLTGDVTGSTSWDGSGNASITATVANDSHTHSGTSSTGSWTTHSTAYGNIQLGPANSSWAHIYSSGPNFYFNKELHVLGDKVWHAGNDGSGSGLDADTVDGIQASSFLRSDVADTKTSGNLIFSDNVRADFGGGSDLNIYHNGTSSYIDNNTSHLYIRNNVDNDDGGNIYIQSKSGENGITLFDDSYVSLYDNGVERLRVDSPIYAWADIRLQGSGYDLIYDKGTYLTTLSSVNPASQSQIIYLPDASGYASVKSFAQGHELSGVSGITLTPEDKWRKIEIVLTVDSKVLSAGNTTPRVGIDMTANGSAVSWRQYKDELHEYDYYNQVWQSNVAEIYSYYFTKESILILNLWRTDDTNDCRVMFDLQIKESTDFANTDAAKFYKISGSTSAAISKLNHQILIGLGGGTNWNGVEYFTTVEYHN